MSGTSVMSRAMAQRRSRFTAHWWFWNIVPALPLPIYFYLKLDELSESQARDPDSRPMSVSADARPLGEDEQGPPSGLGGLSTSLVKHDVEQSKAKWKHWLEWRLQRQADEVKELQRRILGIEGALRETVPGLDAKLPAVPFAESEAPPKLTPQPAPSEEFLETAKGFVLTGVSEIQEHIWRFAAEVMQKKEEEPRGALIQSSQAPPTATNATGPQGAVSQLEESNPNMQAKGLQEAGRVTPSVGGTTGGLSEGREGATLQTGEGSVGIIEGSVAQSRQENGESEAEVQRPGMYRRALAGIAGLPGRLYRVFRPTSEEKSKE